MGKLQGSTRTSLPLTASKEIKLRFWRGLVKVPDFNLIPSNMTEFKQFCKEEWTKLLQSNV